MRWPSVIIVSASRRGSRTKYRVPSTVRSQLPKYYLRITFDYGSPCRRFDMLANSACWRVWIIFGTIFSEYSEYSMFVQGVGMSTGQANFLV